MSGIGRVVAAFLLAGAVAGAAAFAHLLGSEPATPLFGPGALPPAPTSALVVQAAAPPLQRALGRPFGPPAATTFTPARPIVAAPVKAPAARRSLPAARAQLPAHLPARQRLAAPAALASLRGRVTVPPATPKPATPTPAAAAPVPAPAAAPAPAPAPAERVLAQTAPVVVTTPVASDDGKHSGAGQDKSKKKNDRSSDPSGHNKGGSNQNGDSSGNNGPTVLAPVPADTSAPAPVATPPLPSPGPPSVDVTPGTSGGQHDPGHDNGHGDNGHGNKHGGG